MTIFAQRDFALGAAIKVVEHHARNTLLRDAPQSQTLTTREEESFIRLLNPRCGIDRTGSLMYPADCLYNLTISTSSTISISSPTMVRAPFHLEIVRLIFVVASARRRFWHTQIDETSLDQICRLNLDQGDLNAEFFERRNR